MGNAESSSSRDGWGYGEEGGENREEPQRDGQAEVKKALKVAATGAAIAYGAWKILSQSEVVEEEEKKQVTSWTSTVAGQSSASPGYNYSPSPPPSPPPEGYFKGPPKDPLAVWSPPPKGCFKCFKLNTAFSGPSGGCGPSGIGWLIRNHLGDMVDCGAEQVYLPRNFIDDNSGGVAVHKGEALALLKGLEEARDFGCRNVIAETDHKSNVDCINNDRYKGDNYITRIREARDTWFNKCRVTHVDREANRCANHLASIGMRQGTRSYEQLRDSPDLNKLLQQDRHCAAIAYAPEEAQAVWSPPPKGYLKLNTDFSGPSGGSGPWGIGWLIRNYLGEMVNCGAEQVDICWNSIDDNSGRVPVHKGEDLALFIGLEKARDFGCSNVIAETDNESIADCIKNNKYYKSNDYTRIREAQKTWFDECEVIHVHREANRCANHLATIGRKHGSRSYEQLRDSPDLKNLLQQDSQRLFAPT